MLPAILLACVGHTVTLRGDAAVRGPCVELSEVADIDADSSEVARRLAGLSLGPAPAPGAARIIRREDVSLALRHAGIPARATGAATCRLRACSDSLPAADLEAAARSALATLLHGRDYELKLIRSAPDLALPEAESRRELIADLGQRVPAPGVWSVPVDVWIDGRRIQTAWLTLEVLLFERVPVATRDLNRGEVVEASAWRLERLPVEAASARPALPEELAGATCLRDLRQGGRISATDVRREPVVRSGDLVEIEVVRGPVRARSRAIARGQGVAGDRIEVQSGESQRRLVGVVVARGLVRVELADSPRTYR